LLGVLIYFGLPGGVSEHQKEAMRQLAMRGGPYTSQELADLLAYCETDVTPLGPLLEVMRGEIEAPATLPAADRAKAFGQALQRGDYIKALAGMESIGIPVDVHALHTLRAKWGAVEKALIAKVDVDFGVYQDGSFHLALFEDYLNRHGLGWPLTETGRLKN
jgi:hypothetical protein